MNIPVFHDDQHGTAIISAAALINGLELVGKMLGREVSAEELAKQREEATR